MSMRLEIGTHEDICVISVGQPFRLFTGRNLYGQSGAIMEALHGGEFVIMVLLPGMTPEEKMVLRGCKIEVRMYKEGCFLLFMFRYQGTDLINEASFDPTLYADDRTQTLIKSNMVTVVGLDTLTGLVQTLRYANLPLTFMRAVLGPWEQAKSYPNYSRIHTGWREDLERRYSTMELWEMSQPLGCLGDQ